MNKNQMGKIRTDYDDPGCAAADKKLGHKSKCTQCPFDECIRKSWSWPPEEIRNSEIVYHAWSIDGNIGRVAQKLKMSKGTVRKYLHGFMFENIHFYTSVTGPDPEMQDLIRQYIIQEYERGTPIKKAAWVMGISYQHACRILQAAGKQLARGRPRKNAAALNTHSNLGKK